MKRNKQAGQAIRVAPIQVLSRRVAAVIGLTALSIGVSGQSSRIPPKPAHPPFDVMEQSIEDLQRAMQEGKVTSRELVDLYLARIEAYDQQGPALNAIVATNPRARDAAAMLDDERSAGRVRGPLHGIPVLVKDNYETIEMPTAAGSLALAAFHPKRDAYLVRRLKDAGAVILAKTNMHELASGITTVGSRFGQTRNPYDLDRNPGGSSGGTGAAVAANFAAAGMGSDTCGSIRNPASHNNLVGLRGTQGLSSRTGIVPLSSTQDIGGPIARTIADLALMLDATVGVDTDDAQTAWSAGHIPSSYRAGLRADVIAGARLGVIRSLFGSAPEDQEVTRVVNRALDSMKKAGADINDVVVPGLDDLLRDSSMINADFKFDFAEYLARSDNPPVRSLAEILDRGLYHAALESAFRMRNSVEARDTDQSRRARIKRTAIRQAVEAVLTEHRLVALVYPTLRRKPARIGDGQSGSTCQLSAHSGLPALGVPAGFSDDDVPIGIDLLGAAFSEPQLLSLGYAIERTLNLRRPPFSTPPLLFGKAPEPRTAMVTLPRDASARASKGAVGTSITFTFDPTTSRLGYVVTASDSDRIAAIWLHSGTPDKPAAARHQLLGRGRVNSGTITLSASDRRDLSSGRLMVRFYRTDGLASPGDVLLQFSE
jgi:amidase